MPKRSKFKSNMARIVYVSLGLLLLSGCSIFNLFGSGVEKNPDEYRVGSHEWVGDSIQLRIYRTSEPDANPSLPGITAECKSCNFLEPAKQLSFNAEGEALLYFPEARQLISPRIHLHGSGIDTTFIQTQRQPLQAMAYYHLRRPLVGRVLVGEFAPLYLDSTQDSVAASANVGDELNLYGERSAFFIVQHPNFSMPLYLYKGDAVRLY